MLRKLVHNYSFILTNVARNGPTVYRGFVAHLKLRDYSIIHKLYEMIEWRTGLHRMCVLLYAPSHSRLPIHLDFWSLHSFLLVASTVVIWKGLFFFSFFHSSFSSSPSVCHVLGRALVAILLLFFHMPTNKLKSTWYPFVALLPPGAHEKKKKIRQKHQHLFGFTLL